MRVTRRFVVVLGALAAATSGIHVHAAPRQRGTLVGVDGRTGVQLFRAETAGPGSLLVTFAADGIVVAERRGCFSPDLPDAERSTVLVGYDARTGRERWHRAGLLTAGLQHDGWAQLAPGVLPARNPTTGEQLGLAVRSGKTLWSRGVGATNIRASTRDLLVTSGAGPEGDRLEGIDRASGLGRWTYELHDRRRAQLVGAAGDVVAVVAADPPAASLEGAAGVGASLQILSARDGRLRHEVPLVLTVEQKLQGIALEVRGQTIVVDAGELLAFDADTGLQRWRAPGSLDATLPRTSGVLLVRSGAGTGAPVVLVALDLATGRPRWTHDLGPSSFGAARAGTTLVLFRRGHYDAIDVSTGRPRWRLGPERNAAGVAGMSAEHLYLAGGCPVSIAD